LKVFVKLLIHGTAEGTSRTSEEAGMGVAFETMERHLRVNGGRRRRDAGPPRVNGGCRRRDAGLRRVNIGHRKKRAICLVGKVDAMVANVEVNVSIVTKNSKINIRVFSVKE
jgi:hypothetical protein